jgi:DNA polymerase-3 subunit delta'
VLLHAAAHVDEQRDRERLGIAGEGGEVDTVLACRDAIEANVKPKIAVEAMMLNLWRG